jgi:hypothetical protein
MERRRGEFSQPKVVKRAMRPAKSVGGVRIYTSYSTGVHLEHSTKNAISQIVSEDNHLNMCPRIRVFLVLRVRKGTQKFQTQVALRLPGGISCRNRQDMAEATAVARGRKDGVVDGI